MIPLSPEVYFASLADYNEGALIAIFSFLTAGAATILATLWRVGHWFRFASAVLAGAWLHLGWAYHLNYFSGINFWDYPIGVLCILQAALLLGAGVIWGNGEQPARLSLGAATMRLALIGLPLVGWLIGHPWREVGTFGTSPGPTLLFTAAVLLSSKGLSRLLWVIPLVLCAPALAMAFAMPIWQDLTLLLVPLLAVHAMSSKRAEAPE